MKGYIYITLRSDLCAASGDGFSLSIDTDVCSDRYGFPYIPSRRLKGCLREAAEYIGCVNTDKIFGRSGDVSCGSLKITDARLEDYDELCAQAEAIDANNEQILALFTSVKASTAIENDTAKENSLRFTRVVNHYSPFDSSELRFVSEIEYEKGNELDLERACKALRNIGYKRTRGFGSVKCEFVSCGDNSRFVIDIPKDDKEYELRFTVKLDSPVMLAGRSSMETLDYIPGTSVLGAMAAGYLKTHSADERFEELFLKGSLKFSNMYISQNGKTAEPAPAVLGKTKGSSKLFYLPVEDNEEKTDGNGEPIMPKGFKGGYLIGETEIKPASRIIYHHGKKQGDNDKLLYTQQCLCEGQEFSGRISGKGIDLCELVSVFECGEIDIGRSKTAQYSTCKIIAADCAAKQDDRIGAGNIYALLCSDVLLIDENANYTTDVSVLAKALGADIETVDTRRSSLRYKTVMGFVSVGRYKRSHVRCFEKGSIICFRSNESMMRWSIIGERQNEGFGEIRLCTKDELKQLGKDAAAYTEHKSDKQGKLKKLIDKNAQFNDLTAAAIKYANDNYKNNKREFIPSFVGRLMLMVDQAENECDLDARIASIKTESKRKAAQKFKDGIKQLGDFDVLTFMKTALTVVKYKNKEIGNDE